MTIPQLACRAVVGSANNQLATDEDGQRVHDAGVLYAPDYVVNAGGVINIAEEHHGYDRERAKERIKGIRDNLLGVFDVADADGLTTAEAADRFGERRIEAAKAAWRDALTAHPPS